MLPITFPQVNFEYNKPKDMTDEQCSSLPVHRGQDQELNPVIVSCWQLSKEDIEDVLKNGCIWLQIMGNGMPPVSLYTENPFDV